MQMKIKFNAKDGIWDLEKDGRYITVISWAATEKGPLTEITLYSDNKIGVIIELLESKFRADFSNPVDIEKTKVAIQEIGKTIFEKLDSNSMDYRTQLSAAVWNLVHKMNLRGAHVYYGLGLHFGIERNCLQMLRTVDVVPPRAMKYPGTRDDAIM
jgi:hypothetical protein